MSGDAAYRSYRRAFNQAVHGTADPTPAQFGQWFDRRYGLWLPPRLLKRRRPA